jgi:hypothetical protein
MPKLTENAIHKLQIPEGKREAWLSDTDVQGLRVRATTGGAKTFMACWTDRATGERRREKLGAWGALTLANARTAARAILGDVARGEDPSEKRMLKRKAATEAKAAAALTLRVLVEQWAVIGLQKRKARYRAEATRAIAYAFQGQLDQTSQPTHPKRRGDNPGRPHASRENSDGRADACLRPGVLQLGPQARHVAREPLSRPANFSRKGDPR